MTEMSDGNPQITGGTGVRIVLPLSGVVIFPATRTKLQVDANIGGVLAKGMKEAGVSTRGIQATCLCTPTRSGSGGR